MTQEKFNPENREFMPLNEPGERVVTLDILVKQVIQYLMGVAIDYGRMSGMSDRSFEQFSKLIKDSHYKKIEDTLAILKEEGYLPEDGK